MSLLHLIAFTKIKGIGPKTGRELLTRFGSAEAFFSASRQELRALTGPASPVAESAYDKSIWRAAEDELTFIEKHQIRALSWTDDRYPKRLAECPDAPVLLYFKGNAPLDALRIVSVVGTRHATPYGSAICADLIRDLAPYGVTVVSGLAQGIDSCAHRSALEYGLTTIGVLGHGLDRIYPAVNRQLAARMVEQGGLLTEFTSGTRPEKYHFPMRNRIIAGLADVTVVVEAAARGGALITAELANSYHRDVCAFPGNLNQEFSAGCNYLIKTNRAHLITDARDLAHLMNWSADEESQAGIAGKAGAVSGPEQQVYALLSAKGPLSVDELAGLLQWPPGQLAMTLLELELKGLAAAMPGSVFRTK